MQKAFPNLITLGRLTLAVIVLAILCVCNGPTKSSFMIDLILVLFILSMISDWLDGYLARKYNAQSQLGRMLDPFVDKVLICGIFILLSGPTWNLDNSLFSGNTNTSGVLPWMTLIVITRELMVSMLRGFGEAAGVDFSARFVGKFKLCFQTGMIIAVFFIMSHLRGQVWIAHLRDIFLILTVIITAYSCVDYVRLTVQGMFTSSNK